MPESLGETFLLEVRAEEIPARMLRAASEELASSVLAALVGHEIVPSELETAFTPRRLVLVLKGLPHRAPERRLLEIGPPVNVAFGADGQPTSAAKGFARKVGLAVEDLERRFVDRDGGIAVAGVAGAQERIVAARVVPGRSVHELLGEIVPFALQRLSWPKSMKWGIGRGPWVRPVHGLVALLGSEVVEFELFGIPSGRTTVGHPILSPERIELSRAEDYAVALDARGLVVDPAVRERKLREALELAARREGGEWVPDPDLLERLVAVCEIPGVVRGRFEERFLGLPEEILRTALRDHQSAFTVRQGKALLPVFLTVMDREGDPRGHVQAGNEWVVAARLEDAFFFWQKDRERPLEEFGPRLEGLGVHEELGTYAEKAVRLVELVGRLAEPELDAELTARVRRAAERAKLDLVTGLVGEFPTLQGIAGGLYLREQGEDFEVWSAVYDQYLPATADDELPRSRAGRLLALADRLDHLAGFFSLGERYYPSGSSDPFALRRAALGVVRLALAGAGPEDLGPVMEAALAAHAKRAGRAVPESAAGALATFLRERLMFLLEREGIPSGPISAALGSNAPALGVRSLAARARALGEMAGDPALTTVAQAFKRITNILKGVEPSRCERELLRLEAEQSLRESLEKLAPELAASACSGQLRAAFTAAARLAEPLDRFFVEVLVMDPDPRIRANRLALLAEIRETLVALADFGRLSA